MIYLRYNEGDYGILKNNFVYKIKGDIFYKFEIENEGIQLSDVKLLPPVLPSKIVAVGFNYKDHAYEMQEELPKEPKIFLKPSTSIIGPKASIILPSSSKRVDFEAELGIVIKKTAKNIEASEAKNFILGYTCANDITARDLQAADGQWTRAKSFDTFCPIGPWITDEIDPDNSEIMLLKNNKIMQHSNTSNFIFKTAEIVSFVSKVMTLLPGDVIITGTPAGIGPMKDGDKIVVSIKE